MSTNTENATQAPDALTPEQITAMQLEKAIFLELGQEAIENASEVLARVAIATSQAVAAKFDTPDGQLALVLAVTMKNTAQAQAFMEATQTVMSTVYPDDVAEESTSDETPAEVASAA